MTYLGWLGILQTETYAIIKKISKKKFKAKELAELKEKLLKGWIKNVGSPEGFQKTWEIIEAAAKYSFNASHALSYAYDSVYGAYAKAHYPFEFYTVMLQHYADKGNKDKVIAFKHEMLEFAGIKEGAYKFGLDNRKFTMDKKNRVIHPSLSSIKGFSQTVAELLYELGQQRYKDFLEVLIVLKEHSISDAKIQDLINIEYFSDYGDIKYLMRYLEMFNQFRTGKGFLKTIKKEKGFLLGIDFDIIRRHCESETVKTFSKLDSISIIKECMVKVEEKTTNKEKLLRRREVLGYCDVIDKKYSGYCMVEEVNTKYAPKISLYALANGSIIDVKIPQKCYTTPITKDSIVQVIDAEYVPKLKWIDEKWVKQTEKEWVVSEYKVY